MLIFTLLLFSLIINILTPVVLLSKYKKITLYFLFFYYFGINYLNYIMGTNQSIENFIIKAYPDVLMLSGGVSGNPRKFRHSALWNFLGGWSAA
ncbi:TPA: hypothetical protein MI934_30285 [Klebsiella pneumoniae]|nr:hypothetical protein [Klebsiella pneumoniae]HBY8899565.1 hypothetical protein [Klebsiella pneumoniae]